MPLSTEKIYLETTVFNRLLEPERDYYEETQQLFDAIAAGQFAAYTSVYVVAELSEALEPKRSQMLAFILHYGIEVLTESDEVTALAEEYAVNGVVPRSSYFDRLHIACAAIHGMDRIISLNFKHIHRLKTQELVSRLNALRGLKNLYITTPMEEV
jgi:predicted nucleic acid-binding protein